MRVTDHTHNQWIVCIHRRTWGADDKQEVLIHEESIKVRLRHKSARTRTRRYDEIKGMCLHISVCVHTESIESLQHEAAHVHTSSLSFF